MSCKPGQFLVHLPNHSSSSSSAVSAVRAGAPLPPAAQRCDDCAAGYASASGLVTACTACARGTYAGQGGRSACASCDDVSNSYQVGFPPLPKRPRSLARSLARRTRCVLVCRAAGPRRAFPFAGRLSRVGPVGPGCDACRLVRRAWGGACAGRFGLCQDDPNATACKVRRRRGPWAPPMCSRIHICSYIYIYAYVIRLTVACDPSASGAHLLLYIYVYITYPIGSSVAPGRSHTYMCACACIYIIFIRFRPRRRRLVRDASSVPSFRVRPRRSLTAA